MEAIIFPGCLVLYRFPEYEASSIRVLQMLGINARLLPGACCCGSFLQGVNDNWPIITAYNMALAERAGGNLITLCGGCTNTFKRCQAFYHQHPEELITVNSKLVKLGLNFTNTVKISHIIEVLDGKQSALKSKMRKKIPLRAAMMNPCQVFRPKEIMDFDETEKPVIMDKLASLSGAEIVHYKQESDCCGSSLSLTRPEIAQQLGSERLKELERMQADVLVTACGNCHLLLDRRQVEYYHGKRIPGIFLSQLLGLAAGFSLVEMGIKSPALRRLLADG